MDSTTESPPAPLENQGRSAESARVRAAVKDGLAAMMSLVRRHSSTGKPTDAATRAAARHVDVSLSPEVRGLLPRVIDAGTAALESPAADDPQPGGFTARQIANAFVDPTALMRLVGGRTQI